MPTRHLGLLPVDERDAHAARAPLYLASKEISKEISLSEEEEKGFSTLLKAISRASDGGTLWPGSKPEARLRSATVKANGYVLRIAERVGRQDLKGPLEALAIIERFASMPELLDEVAPRSASFEERVTREELRQVEGNARAHQLAGEPVPEDISERIKGLSHRLGTMEG